jgi:hypothetical protein
MGAAGGPPATSRASPGTRDALSLGPTTSMGHKEDSHEFSLADDSLEI